MYNFKKKYIFKGLYIVTPCWEDTDKLLFVTEKILKAGCILVQYRNKLFNKILHKNQALALLKICHKYNIPLIINDNIELCQEIDADGIHIGYKDISIINARKILGNKKIIGSSCYNSLYIAKKSFFQGASYISYGGFYYSKTKKYPFKTNFKLISLSKKKIPLPITVIGGINKNNFLPLLNNGADMISIISSIYKSLNFFSDTFSLVKRINFKE